MWADFRINCLSCWRGRRLRLLIIFFSDSNGWSTCDLLQISHTQLLDWKTPTKLLKPDWRWISIKHKSFLPLCIECQRRPATRKLSVCPSVRPAVCQTHGLWQNGRKFCPDSYTIRKNFSLVLWAEEWLVTGDPFHLKFWVKLTPLERKRRFSVDIRS